MTASAGRTAHRQTAPRSRASALFGGPIGDFDAEFTGQERMRALLNPHFSARACTR